VRRSCTSSGYPGALTGISPARAAPIRPPVRGRGAHSQPPLGAGSGAAMRSTGRAEPCDWSNRERTVGLIGRSGSRQAEIGRQDRPSGVRHAPMIPTLGCPGGFWRDDDPGRLHLSDGRPGGRRLRPDGRRDVDLLRPREGHHSSRPCPDAAEAVAAVTTTPSRTASRMRTRRRIGPFLLGCTDGRRSARPSGASPRHTAPDSAAPVSEHGPVLPTTPGPTSATARTRPQALSARDTRSCARTVGHLGPPSTDAHLRQGRGRRDPASSRVIPPGVG
jgi:hypothetical protein